MRINLHTHLGGNIDQMNGTNFGHDITSSVSAATRLDLFERWAMSETMNDTIEMIPIAYCK
jgi:hypothetical protein